MTATLFNPQMIISAVSGPGVPKIIDNMISDLMVSLPDTRLLTDIERRNIIARYTSVLEGNFIYWMTGTLLAVQSEEARPILLENLHEEISDAHPVMMRKFAVAANAYPDAVDALAVDKELTEMREFVGKLSGVRSLLTMAFFEGFIQKFMAYLAALAGELGSSELEYTDVHGVCDIAHTAGLIRAYEIESANYPIESDVDLFEGVTCLRNVIDRIVFGVRVELPAAA